MRTCTKCGVEKEVTGEFFRPHGHSPGFRGACRECEARLQREDYVKNPEKCCAASRKWCRDNPEKHNATKRAWTKANKDKHNATRRKSVYGVSNETFLAMLEKQCGKCAVCGFVFPGINTGDRTVSPHVDHCHKTGAFRGILCSDCNSGIGRLKDDFFTVIKAASYLRKFLT